MNHYQLIPLLTILILLCHAFTLPLYKRKKRVYQNTIGIAWLIFAMTAYSLYEVITKGSYIFKMGHFGQPIGIAFRVGSVDALLAVVFAFIYAMIISYSKINLKMEIEENKVGTYYTLSSLLLVSLFGIVYTYDIFTAFVFLEVNTLAACGLIAIKDHKDNIKSTLKYMILSSLSSGLVLLGIAFLYVISGHLSMPQLHEAIVAQYATHKNIVLTSVSLFTFGVAIKAALFPLHVWLPDAYTAAPTVTSAILSSIVNKAPIYLLVKLYYMVYGKAIIEDSKILVVLLFLGAVAMIMGSLFARTQKELKRMVAYSSVAQVGYIFLGIGLGNALGFIMAIYQMIAHGITKSTLFLITGHFTEKTGFKKLENLKGVGKQMPITLGIFTVCGLSMIGIPVLPGFINKWDLAIASIQAGKLGLLMIILASSLLNATYYFPVIINGYFGEGTLDTTVFDTKIKSVRELSPMLILAFAILALGFLSGKVIDIVELDTIFR